MPGRVIALAQVSGVDILALADAECVPGPLARYFRGADEVDWAAAQRVDPAADSGADWVLSFRAFAIREPTGRVTLVDLGIGPAHGPGAAWAGTGGALPLALAEAGITPRDVHTVVLTHLHADHIGWAVNPSAGSPTFPEAEHLVQRTELANLKASPPGAVWNQVVEPLERFGLLREVDGRRRLPASADVALELLPTPGHTPGHQSLLLRTAGETILFSGDVFVHAVQLVAPETTYVHEDAPGTATATRRTILHLASKNSGWFATPHLGIPFLPFEAVNR